MLDVTPAEIGRELGFPDALSTARAVRALIARKRLEPAQGSYRLLDARPVDASEKEAVGRKPRKTRARRQREAPRPASRAATGGPAYSDFGRAMVDRLVELGREVAEIRTQPADRAGGSPRGARQDRDEAEARARTLAEKVRELEARAEMAESNLRTLLATVRTKETPPRRAGVGFGDGSDPRGAQARGRIRSQTEHSLVASRRDQQGRPACRYVEHEALHPARAAHRVRWPARVRVHPDAPARRCAGSPRHRARDLRPGDHGRLRAHGMVGADAASTGCRPRTAARDLGFAVRSEGRVRA